MSRRTCWRVMRTGYVRSPGHRTSGCHVRTASQVRSWPSIFRSVMRMCGVTCSLTQSRRVDKRYADGMMSAAPGAGASQASSQVLCGAGLAGDVLAVSCGDGKVMLCKENLKGGWECVSEVEQLSVCLQCH
jgi:hypothetical protein